MGKNKMMAVVQENAERYPTRRMVRIEKIVKERVRTEYYHIPQYIRSPEEAHHTILEISECHRETQEVLGVISLNTKNKVIGHDIVHKGSVNASIVHPRDVFKAALLNGASSIMVYHNHPSEDPTPSREDINVTKRLAEAGKIMGVELLDHIIVGNEDDFTSLKEKGYL